MLYFTELDSCPVGCGDLVFLKSIESRNIFLHCTSCGVAWENPPSLHVVDTLDPPESFAPAGIEFPSREDIEAAGFGGYIAAERQDEDCIKGLWRLRAKTYFAEGDYAKGISVLTEVIDTWHQPPSTAYFLRADAYRCIGDLQRAAEDERTAEQVRLKYLANWDAPAKQTE